MKFAAIHVHYIVGQLAFKPVNVTKYFLKVNEHSVIVLFYFLNIPPFLGGGGGEMLLFFVLI